MLFSKQAACWVAALCFTGSLNAATVLNPSSVPIVISTPGSYVLGGDIISSNPSITAITIATGGVSLDLGGHIVQGPATCSEDANMIVSSCTGSAGYGVAILLPWPMVNSPTSIVKISNGMIRGWGSGGLVGSGLATIRVESIDVAGNGYFGIGIDYGEVRASTATGNAGHGISVQSGAVYESRAFRNLGAGVRASDGMVTGSFSELNGRGIDVTSGRVENSVARSNMVTAHLFGTGEGIVLGGNGVASHVQSVNNQSHGISGAAIIGDSISSGNGGVGVSASHCIYHTRSYENGGGGTGAEVKSC